MEYWGQVPVVVCISDIEFGTALFPKNGRYLIPLKDVVRKAAAIELDQVLAVGLNVGREWTREGATARWLTTCACCGARESGGQSRRRQESANTV